MHEHHWVCPGALLGSEPGPFRTHSTALSARSAILRSAPRSRSRTESLTSSGTLVRDSFHRGDFRHQGHAALRGIQIAFEPHAPTLILLRPQVYG